jgi:hypothetical protein
LAIIHHFSLSILIAHQKLIAHHPLIAHPHRHRSPAGAHSCVIDLGAVLQHNSSLAGGLARQQGCESDALNMFMNSQDL